MKYIVKYQCFNEKKGISDSSEKITDKIWQEIETPITNQKNITKIFSFDEEDFKIKDIEIEININKGQENTCYAMTTLKDSVMEDDFIKNIRVSFIIKYDVLDEPFLYYIKSVIFHEILHVFQHYNLKLKNKFRPESFSIGSVLPQLRNNVKTEYVKYILDMLYYSLSHELSAQVHQYYLYMKKDLVYKKLMVIKTSLSDFKLKNLNTEENNELNYVKKHILGSIGHFTTNKNYKKSISKSIWTKNNDELLTSLHKIFVRKSKWIDKKIKLINLKLKISYNETLTYYGDLDNYPYMDTYLFIKEKLNDCPTISNI